MWRQPRSTQPPALILVGSPGPLSMLGMGTSVGIYIPPAVVDSDGCT